MQVSCLETASKAVTIEQTACWQKQRNIPALVAF
jgi:hypothetical protein